MGHSLPPDAAGSPRSSLTKCKSATGLSTAALASRFLALRFQRFTQGNRLAGVADDTRRIEVDVGQGGEEGAGAKLSTS
ncbi:hypothetical protein LNP17_10225 [Klebsiella variicola subsp. variicola]|nr:hypothetical protein [Klebsiella variicola subsp. variicola]